MTSFDTMGLIEPLRQALTDAAHTQPTPIQARAIPAQLEGRDLLGLAQTGTGKTAAFVLPLLQNLDARHGRPAARRPRALILAPTRELAVQLQDSIRDYGRHLRLRSTLVLGGVPLNRQIRALAGRNDIVVATPGRLVDLLQRDALSLEAVRFFVLDEADRMLDMGFIRDVQRIADLIGTERQTLLFSATLPKSVTRLAADLLDDPVRVEVAPPSTTAERISQRVMFVPKTRKLALLKHLLGDESITRSLVFTRTKHGANRLARQLDTAGVSTAALHGNKSQSARQKALNGFKNGTVRVLVATDIAARGIDVDEVSHVINFDLPAEPETYVHRIGRTARAGADGEAVSLCDREERDLLRDIERSIRQQLVVNTDHPFAEAIEHSDGDGSQRREGAANAPKNRRPHRGKGKPSRNRRSPRSKSGGRMSGNRVERAA